MKTSHPKTYLCRKCNRVDFKSPIEFTNHLKNCCGAMAAPIVAPPPSSSNGLKAELLRLRSLGVEVRDLADKLLKKIK